MECSATKVSAVQLLKRGAWPADHVYVGMPGKAARAWGLPDESVGPFGKPWNLLADQRGWEVAYREYLYLRLVNDPEFQKAARALHGKTLVCWCRAKEMARGVPVACHADTLSKAVEWLTHEAPEAA